MANNEPEVVEQESAKFTVLDGERVENGSLVNLRHRVDFAQIEENVKSGKLQLRVPIDIENMPFRFEDGSDVDWAIDAQPVIVYNLVSKAAQVAGHLRDGEVTRKNADRLAKKADAKLLLTEAQKRRKRRAATRAKWSGKLVEQSTKIGHVFADFNFNEALAETSQQTAQDVANRKIERQAGLVGDILAGVEVTEARCKTWITAAALRLSQQEKLIIPQGVIDAMRSKTALAMGATGLSDEEIAAIVEETVTADSLRQANLDAIKGEIETVNRYLAELANKPKDQKKAKSGAKLIKAEKPSAEIVEVEPPTEVAA